MKACQYYKEDRDGELSFCSHSKNKDNHEGNCQSDSCPFGSEFFVMAQKASSALRYIENAPRIMDSKLINERNKILEEFEK